MERETMDNLKRVEGSSGQEDVAALMADLGRKARAAAHALSLASTDAKNRALLAAAKAIRDNAEAILAANAEDFEAAQDSGVANAFLDRLRLDAKRIEAMARGVEEVASLPDPVGRLLASFERPNGLLIERVATPLEVVGIIYESRPAVTADAGVLCLKSGNAVIYAAARRAAGRRKRSISVWSQGSSQRAFPRQPLPACPSRIALLSAKC